MIEAMIVMIHHKEGSDDTSSTEMMRRRGDWMTHRSDERGDTSPNTTIHHLDVTSITMIDDPIPIIVLHCRIDQSMIHHLDRPCSRG